MTNNNRILWIDYAKFIAIAGVVLVHTAISANAKTFIYIWLIPLFFFLAGVFAKKYDNYSAYFKRSGLRLVIPYIGLNAVTYLFWLFVGRNFGYDSDIHYQWWKPLSGIIYGSGHSIIHYVPLWFLPCMFVAETIYFFINRYSKSLKIKILFVGLCVIIAWLNYLFNPVLLPCGTGSALAMIVFYALGDFAGKKLLQLSANLPKNNVLLFTVTVAAFVCVHFWVKINACVMVADNQYGNFLLFLIGAPFGIIGIVAFCKLIENIVIPIKPFLYIGRNTLTVLGLHLIAMSFIKAISVYLFLLPLSIFDQTLSALTLAAGAIIICVPIIFIINRYFPKFVGKNLNR